MAMGHGNENGLGFPFPFPLFSGKLKMGMEISTEAILGILGMGVSTIWPSLVLTRKVNKKNDRNVLDFENGFLTKTSIQ